MRKSPSCLRDSVAWTFVATIPVLADGITFDSLYVSSLETNREVNVRVLRDLNLGSTVSVDYYTTNGTATAQLDYTTTRGTLTFGPTESEKVITVPLLDDLLGEGTEDFEVVLTNPSANARLGQLTRKTVNVLDSEKPIPPEVLALVGTNKSVRSVILFVSPGVPWNLPNLVSEGDTSAVLSVERLGDLDDAVAVSYTTLDESARAGMHYVATNGVIRFEPAQSSAEIRVALLDNGEPNDLRIFHVTLSGTSLTSAAALPVPEAVWILDNELPASFDPGFVSPFAGRSVVHALSIRPNNSLLIGGALWLTDGSGPYGFARLGANGSLPSLFKTSENFPGVFAFAERKDGRIVALVGWDDWLVPSGRAIEGYLPTGARDPDFQPFIPSDGRVSNFALLPDDRLLATTGGQLLRLNADGTPDQTLRPFQGIGLLLLLRNGDALIGGLASGGGIAPPFFRLQPDGILGSEFQPILSDRTGLEPKVHHAIEQTDGKVIIAGWFDAVDGLPRTNLARLNSDGSVDASFNAVEVTARPNEFLQLGPIEIDGLAQDGTGRLLVSHRAYGRWNLFAGRLIRLNSDGSLDSSFDSGLVYGQSRGNRRLIRGPIHALGFQSDGWIIAGGSLTEMNGWVQSGIVRLRPLTRGVQAVDFTAAQFSRGEAEGSVEIALRRVGDVTRGALVRVTADAGTAVQGEDFLPLSTTVSFASLETNRTVSIPLLNDTRFEGDETVALSLAPATNDVLIGAAKATLRIVDDEQPGSLDFSFNPRSRVAPFLDSMPFCLQPDGKLVVRETVHLNQWDDFIVRLNPDGSKDPSFRPLSVLSYRSIIAQPDGKLLAYRYENPQLVRLNADGSIDPSFTVQIGIQIYDVLPQPDGKVVARAQFAEIGLPGDTGIVRLLSNGLRDTSFASAADGEPGIRAMSLAFGTHIVVGGAFKRTQGAFRTGLVRLKPDGSLDPSFDPPRVVSGSVSLLSVDSPGRVVVSGELRLSMGSNILSFARFLPDGNLDTGFQPPPFTHQDGTPVQLTAILAQDDGRVIVAGRFTHVGGIPRANLARLRADGSLDQTFGPLGGVWEDWGPTWKYPGIIGSIFPSPDGQIFIGGSFNIVDGASTSAIARLNGDSVHRFVSVHARPNGSIQFILTGRAGYRQIVEASEDLQFWRSVYTNAQAPISFNFEDFRGSVPHRFYRIRGD